MDLEEQNKRLKEEAKQILEDSKIVGILSPYGEVKFGGSYVLDTMVRPDLDIFIICEKHNRDLAREIYKKLFEIDYFQELDYVDGIKFKTMASPGMYFQAWKNIKRTDWKLDINFMDKEEDKSEELTEKFRKLLNAAPEKRIIIMEIKVAVREGFKYIKGVDGRKIYNAVLEKGVKGVEEFKKFLENNEK